MPDALSKTVPIWCAVLNTVLFPDDLESHQVRSPSQIISKSEHSQIEARTEEFVKRFIVGES